MTYHSDLTHLYLYGRLLASQLAIHKRDTEKHAHWTANFFSPEYRGVDWSYLANSAKFAIETESKLAGVKQKWKKLAKNMVQGKDYFIDNGFVYVAGEIAK